MNRYNAGGISIDWAHKDVGIDLVYTLEMRDAGIYGFLLPEGKVLNFLQLIIFFLIHPIYLTNVTYLYAFIFY